MVPGSQIIGLKILVKPVLHDFHSVPFTYPPMGKGDESDGTNMKLFYYKRTVRGFQETSEGGPSVRGRATTPGADLPNLPVK